ncbi:hypothetical protein CEP51_011339 [Fusarium floridanum]|uniref:Uncharacterized protein n=1 Tax=Fusarium floridanum TaxID=1325733 RepID=A0A428RBN8_9HYPO|nr:hypothetical protein CEP51_011339 [Fusarium floridanum]
MAWSQEAIIALVGVLINLPHRRRNDSSAGTPDGRGSDSPLLPPRRSTWEPQYALALPYAVPLINMAQQPGRQ